MSGEDAVAGSAGIGEGHVLNGLDGATPLGFLAGLGACRVLADRAGPRGTEVRLCWRNLDAWRPVVHGPASLKEIVEAVTEDVNDWDGAPILAFRYLKVEKNGPKGFAGLTPPIAVLRKWLSQRRDADDHQSLSYACALMCETATSPIKEAATPDQLEAHGIAADPDAPLDRSCMQTFFDFTSRNAQFLDQVEEIRKHLDHKRIEAGLLHGLPDREASRTMDWDPAADTPGAIYTGYARGFLPVAEWLAFRGLVYFPLAGSGRRLQTTACSGRRKAGVFIWPLWEVPARAEAIRSLVAYPGLERLDTAERQALGVVAVHRADLTKKADGYSGMFAPAQPV